MTAGKVADIFAAIIVVGLVTTIVAHPGSAKLVTSIGRAFSGSMRSAMGR